MQYSLRALTIVTILAPPIMAAFWSFPAAIVLFVWCTISTLAIVELVKCWHRVGTDSK